MNWTPNPNSRIRHLAFEVNGQHIYVVHCDLETMMLTFVIKCVFVVVESFVKNHCKGKFLEFSFYIVWFFFHFPKLCFIFMPLCVLLGRGCFGKGFKNFGSRTRNKVSNPWCHECLLRLCIPSIGYNKIMTHFSRNTLGNQNDFLLWQNPIVGWGGKLGV
jgi:hypothetical protein